MSAGLERFKHLLDEFAQQTGNATDVSRLFDAGEVRIGQRTISIGCQVDDSSVGESMVVCRCDVVRFLSLQAEGTYRLLLEANYLWSGTHGATLGLRGRDMVIISIARRIGSLDATKLGSMVASLARDAELWSFALGRPADLPSLTPYAIPAFAYRS